MHEVLSACALSCCGAKGAGMVMPVSLLLFMETWVRGAPILGSPLGLTEDLYLQVSHPSSVQGSCDQENAALKQNERWGETGYRFTSTFGQHYNNYGRCWG